MIKTLFSRDFLSKLSCLSLLVLILVGSLGIVAHVWREMVNLIFQRHLFRSISVTNLYSIYINICFPLQVRSLFCVTISTMLLCFVLFIAQTPNTAPSSRPPLPNMLFPAKKLLKMLLIHMWIFKLLFTVDPNCLIPVWELGQNKKYVENSRVSDLDPEGSKYLAIWIGIRICKNG